MYFKIEKDLKEYSNYFFGPLAQLVEHFPFKEGVIGSNPIRLTKNMKEIIKFYKDKRILVTGATGFKGCPTKWKIIEGFIEFQKIHYQVISLEIFIGYGI